MKTLLGVVIGSLVAFLATVQAGDFMATTVTLRAFPQRYEGPCPTVVRFEGSITANGPGRIEYVFQWSNGERNLGGQLEFHRAGTQSVGATKTFQELPAGLQSGWVSLVIVNVPSPRETARASYSVRCDDRSAPPADSSGPASDADPREGRFRITINGFSCSRPTFDNATQSDGVDDEVFVRADVALYDHTGRRRGPSVSAFSKIIGDTNGFPRRLRGGSGHSVFGGNGGFKEGDTFPSGGRPWERRSRPTHDRLPLFVWEGTLRFGDTGLLIVPSLWEWDGDVSLEDDYAAALVGFWGDGEVVSRMRDANTVGGTQANVGSATLRRLFAGVRLSNAFAGNPKNRPIGMQPGRGDFHVYVPPSAFVLSYAKAVSIAGQNGESYGRGVTELTFRDDDAFRGLYQLYLQVEKIP